LVAVVALMITFGHSCGNQAPAPPLQAPLTGHAHLGRADDTEPVPKRSKPNTTRSLTAIRVTFHIEPGTDGDVVRAKFRIHDGFTKGLIRFGAQEDTVSILKYAHSAYPNASEVVVEGTFPMTDASGNTTIEPILNVSYTQATLSKINFSGIDPERIWDIRDGGTIHPDLQ
jgi:hypothetical protein